MQFWPIESPHQAVIYLELELPGKAELAFQKAIRTARRLSSDWWLPECLAGLAIARLRLGDLSVGSLLEEALAAAQRRGQGLLH